MKDMPRDGNSLSDWRGKKATLMHGTIGFYTNVLGLAFFCTLRWVYLKVGGTLVLFINKKNILLKFHYKIKGFPNISN